MKQILKLTLLLILLVFLINGCANYQNPFQKKEKEQVGRGLKLSFEQNTIPDIIYVRQEFPISVLIENYGPEIDGKIKIYDQLEGDDVQFPKGGDYDSIQVNGAEVVEDNLGRIRGKIIPGRIRYPRAGDNKVFYGDNIFEGARANIHVELIMDNYNVKENFPLCVKEEDVQGVPCSNIEVETFADAKIQYRPITFSPVTIEKVEKTITPLGGGEYFLNLGLMLRNAGGGDIIGDKDNAIKTPVISFGRQNLRCSPQYELIFVDNTAVLNCVGTVSLEAGQEYVERMTEIDFTFSYRMRIKKGPVPIIKRQNLES